MKRHGTLFLLGVVLMTGACAEILGIRPPGREHFPHHFHVDRGIGCEDCHQGIWAAGDEGALHMLGPSTCASSCHCSGSKEPQRYLLPATRPVATEARQNLRFEHRSHKPRAKGNCMRCHQDIAADITTLPRMASCGSCHNHVTQLADNCDACHTNIRVEDVKPEDHLIHAGNFLREHGQRASENRQVCASCHAERFCVKCHGVSVPALPEKLAFDDPTQAGVHRAGFKARHPEEAKGDPGLCTTCHAPTYCSGCHDAQKLSATGGGRSPHPPGWLSIPGGIPGQSGNRNDHGRAALREPELCASCHGGAGEALCVGCHKVGGVGGNPHGGSFNSRKRPKTERPCQLCHGGI